MCVFLPLFMLLPLTHSTSERLRHGQQDKTHMANMFACLTVKGMWELLTYHLCYILSPGVLGVWHQVVDFQWVLNTIHHVAMHPSMVEAPGDHKLPDHCRGLSSSAGPGEPKKRGKAGRSPSQVRSVRFWRLPVEASHELYAGSIIEKPDSRAQSKAPRHRPKERMRV